MTSSEYVDLKEHLESHIRHVREHLESQIMSVRRELEVRLGAMQDATRLALEENNRRLDGMNEFRDSLQDQAARSPTRQEMETAFTGVIRDLKDLSGTRERLRALEESARWYSYVIAGIVIAVVANLVLTVIRLPVP